MAEWLMAVALGATEGDSVQDDPSTGSNPVLSASPRFSRDLLLFFAAIDAFGIDMNDLNTPFALIDLELYFIRYRNSRAIYSSLTALRNR